MTLQQALDLARQHEEAGRLQDARALYHQVLAEQPNDAQALNGLGKVVFQLGHHDAAADLLARGIAAKPDDAAYRNDFGAVLMTLPFEGLVDLATRLLGRRQWPEVIACLHRVLALRPEFPEAWCNLGSALQEVGQFEEAIACLHRALALRPEFPEAFSNLCNALRVSGQFAEAVACGRKAVTLYPEFAEAHGMLGSALQQTGCWKEAHACFERACSLQPQNADFHWNLATSQLLTGDLVRGWEEFERRLQIPALGWNRHFTPPQWNGEDIEGKTVLLHSEGGLGDALHFIRYLPMVAQRGAKVLLECQPTLVPLLNRVPGIARVIPRGEALPPFDLHAPLQGLPRVFATTVETIPAQVPYLSAPLDRTAIWRERLAGDALLKVGLAWAGSGGRKDLRSRSLQVFAPLAAVPGVTFYSLQKGPEASQSVPPGMKLIDLTESLDDFADTAALVSNLDLVICVDTAVAHLAGALGQPVWMLIPTVPDFRWLLGREDSPWYPTMRLFRQSRHGDWDEPVRRMEQKLRAETRMTKFE